MKTKIITLLFLCSFLAANAQVELSKVPAGVAQSTSIGNLIGQLGKGIVPSSFADEWSKVKDSWFSNIGNVTDVAGAKKSITTLFNNLKPSALTSAFTKNKGEWMKKLNGAASLGDIGKSLKGLAGGLNPSALTSDFAGDKSAWETALGTLK
jgi:hypothetical protein